MAPAAEVLQRFDREIRWVKRVDRSRAEIRLVPFESVCPREDLPSEPPALRRANANFPLRVYLPPRASRRAPYGRFYLVHNGLGESQADIYDLLCLDLAERRGVPAILMPLPLHYCRHDQFAGKGRDPYRPSSKAHSIITSQRILQAVIASPELLMNSFKQTLDDQAALVRLIDSGSHRFWSRVIEKGAKLSLFGYSFGGFSAIAYLLSNPQRVSRVFLFESGGFIDDIDAGTLFGRSESVARTLWRHYVENGMPLRPHEPLFGSREIEQEKLCSRFLKERMRSTAGASAGAPAARAFKPGIPRRNRKTIHEPSEVFRRSRGEGRELWRDVMQVLYAASSDERSDPIPPGELKLFRQIYLGHERVKYRRALERFEERILMICGGADDIFPTRRLLELGPESGLAMLQVPGLTHWLRHRSIDRWEAWQQMVVEFMEAFVGKDVGARRRS